VSDAARLLAECAASPDDDAPRMVWADLVGGERGELVVVQCKLARGGLSGPETLALRHREHELLDRTAVEWAGRFGDVATCWSFQRGFVEAAELLHARVDESDLRSAPLLRSLRLPRCAPDRALLEMVQRMFRLRALELAGPVDQARAWLELLHRSGRHRELTVLGIDAFDASLLVLLHEIVRDAPIRLLRLRGGELDAESRASLRATAPHLQRVESFVPDAPRALLHDAATLGAPWRHPGPAVLVDITRPNVMHELAVDDVGARVIIGRRSDNQIVTTDTSMGRRHAFFVWTGERHTIRDMSSNNGCRVNQEDTGNQAVELYDGDLVHVGTAPFMYVCAPDARERAASLLADHVPMRRRRLASLFVASQPVERFRNVPLGTRDDMLAAARALADVLVTRVPPTDARVGALRAAIGVVEAVDDLEDAWTALWATDGPAGRLVYVGDSEGPRINTQIAAALATLSVRT
jgi:FHA domain-containing protein